MTKYLVAMMLFCAVGYTQTPQPAGTTQPTPLLKSNFAPNVGPDTPVLTVNGVCNPIPKEKTSENCKTVITRKQFELMVLAVQRNMPPDQRREFAQRYVEALVNDQKARELGLDKGPEFDTEMKLAKEQVLAQELNLAIFGNEPVIPDQMVDKFYRNNPEGFREAELWRIAVPGRQELSPADLSEADERKREQDSANVMKAEAEKLRVRAVAGEDFDKLEAEAFRFAGATTVNFPSTNLGKIRGSSLPPNQRMVMNLKPGDISPVLEDPNGLVIFKVGTIRTIPLEEARPEIRVGLGSARQQTEMKQIVNSAKIKLDEVYFGK
jgi:PPIC-type PPIASE domain